MTSITKELLQELRKYALDVLADDDPAGTCAAHHRGEIAAYDGLLKRLAEPEPIESVRRNRERLGLELFTRVWGRWYLTAEHDQIWVWSWEDDEVANKKLTDQDKEYLENLGWLLDEGGWSLFV